MEEKDTFNLGRPALQWPPDLWARGVYYGKERET